MKKLVCLLSAVLLVFTACSKDDDNESSESVAPILVKKRTYPKPNSSAYSEAVAYNGNKIVSLTGDDYMVKYTYVGDYITKSEEFDENGVLNYTNEYTYTNGKLSSSVEIKAGSDDNYKTKYVYNADGTITYEGFIITSGVENKNGNDGKYTYKDGNLIKEEDSYGVTIYEYDSKNHPYKNVLGYNLLLGDDDARSINNVIKETYISINPINSHTTVVTSVYKYNMSNYPIEKIESRQSGTSISTETTQYAY